MSTETGLLESYVQVAPDSTGKKIRNLLVSVPQADGSTAQAYMQVVGMADADGFPIGDPTAFQQELLAAIHALRESVDLLREELS